MDFNKEENLINFLKKIKNEKKFIITGKKSYNLSGAKNFFTKYLNLGTTKFFFKEENYPTISELKKIIISLKKFNPKFIFAIGGGSVMDYAKIANNLNDIEKLKYNIIKSEKKFKKISHLIAIPTTAGSGAEVTSTAVIYINKKKYSVEGREILPDRYFLLPKLIFKNKWSIKSAAGFDAISQSIESLISRKSNKKSVFFAKESLKLSLINYSPFLKKPNMNNSLKMLLASNLSGKAISISRTTAPHAVSYPLTSYYNISHGNAVSITLSEFLLFNYNNLNKSDVNFDLKKRYEMLFNLTKTKNIFELLRFVDNIKIIGKTENKFKKLNLSKENLIPKILSGINLSRLSNNPVKLLPSDIKFIFENKIDSLKSKK